MSLLELAVTILVLERVIIYAMKLYPSQRIPYISDNAILAPYTVYHTESGKSHLMGESCQICDRMGRSTAVR